MTIPSLPTDNLYKFLALAGLLLLVFALVYPLDRLTELQLKQTKIDTEWQTLALEVSRLAEDSAGVRGEVDRLQKNPNANIQDTKGALDSIATISDRLHTLQIKQISLNGKGQEIKIVSGDIFFMRKLLVFGFLLGGILALIGFLGWYFRVQKPQDMLLRKSLKSNRPLSFSRKASL